MDNTVHAKGSIVFTLPGPLVRQLTQHPACDNLILSVNLDSNGSLNLDGIGSSDGSKYMNSEQIKEALTSKGYQPNDIINEVMTAEEAAAAIWNGVTAYCLHDCEGGKINSMDVLNIIKSQRAQAVREGK